MNPSEILSAQDLATECEVTVGRIHQLIRSGAIRATRVGKLTYIISRTDAERFKAEREREARR
jgi:hypothetical protein